MIEEGICGYLTKICAYSSKGMTIRGERKNRSLQTGIQQRPLHLLELIQTLQV